MVFALTNPTDKPIERWLTAERYNVIGSGAVWPDLDAQPHRGGDAVGRISCPTVSRATAPTCSASRWSRGRPSPTSPSYRRTVSRASTSGSRSTTRSRRRDRQLFNGIHAGLTGLLAIFLTAIFAANHKADFPRAPRSSPGACSTYLCVDFGFFHKLFQLRPEDNAVYRAAGEAAMAVEPRHLPVDVPAPRRLWHGLIRMLIGVWMVAQLTLVAVAVIDPRLAATFARTVVPGDRRLSAVCSRCFSPCTARTAHCRWCPTWMLFLVWIFATGDDAHAAGMSGDVVVSSLVAGLVLIVVLIGFTVTQFAFRSRRAALRRGARRTAAAIARGRRRRLRGLGMECAPRRDQGRPRSRGRPRAEPGELSTKVDDFIKHVHPTDTRTLPRHADVGAGALRRQDPHRFPHAPRGQHLPLVRARGRQRAQRRRPQRCAASALCAT